MTDRAKRYASSPVTTSPRADRPFRRVASIALVAVVALAFSGCESGTAWIARVDKEPIDAPNFWSGVPSYTRIATQQTAPTTGDDEIFPVADAANYAQFLIQMHAIEALNEQNGTEVPPALVSQIRDETMNGPLGAALAEEPDWFVDQIVEFSAASQALVDHYGADADIDDAVEAFYEANKAQFTQVCMDIISDESESELVQARQRIEDGTDLVTVAEAVAAAQGPGPDGQPAVPYGENADGDVGCVDTATLSTLFMDPSQASMLTDADDDTLVGPAPVAGGIFMLFRVRSTEVQSLDEVRPLIEQQVGAPGAREATEALNDYLASAAIELNPRLGEWIDGVGYNPPRGAEQPPGDVELTPETLQMLG